MALYMYDMNEDWRLDGIADSVLGPNVRVGVPRVGSRPIPRVGSRPTYPRRKPARRVETAQTRQPEAYIGKPRQLSIPIGAKVTEVGTHA